MSAGAAVAATDSSPEGIAGEVLFTSAQLTGETSNRIDDLGLFNAKTHLEENLIVTWALTGSQVTVNWSYQKAIEVGPSIQNPDGYVLSHTAAQSTGEQTYRGARVASDADVLGGNLLLLVEESNVTQASIETDSEVTARPTSTEQWGAGQSQDGEIGNGSLSHVQTPLAGNPVLASSGVVSAHFKGNFTFVVWGPTVNVTDPSGRQDNYRSGEWHSNETSVPTVPRNVTQEEHAQLLVLRAVDAKLAMEIRGGEARWTAPAILAMTEGAVAFDALHAYLESDGHFYTSGKQDTLTITGSTTQRIEASGDDERLHSFVSMEKGSVNVPPAGTLPDNARKYVLEEEIPESSSGDATISTEPQERSLPLLLVGWAAAILLGGAALAWFALNRGGYVGRVPMIEEAEHALLEHDSKKARRLARRILRRDEADLDAWFVYGTSLLQEANYDRLVADLGAALEKPVDGDRAGVAYLVAIAHTRANRATEALPWLRIAGQEPALVARIRSAPDFDELRGTEGFNKIINRTAVGDVAYS